MPSHSRLKTIWIESQRIIFFLSVFSFKDTTIHKTSGKSRGSSSFLSATSPTLEHSDIYLQFKKKTSKSGKTRKQPINIVILKLSRNE